MKIPVLCLALTFPFLATLRAAPETKDALAQEMVTLLGIEEMVRSAKTASIQETRRAIDQMIDQVRSAFPELSQESGEAIQAAARKMVMRVEDSWSPEEAINVWKAEYISDFTEDELRSIVASLKTPIGQKQITANKKAGKALQNYLMARGKNTMDEAMKEYIADVQKIVSPKAE